MSFPPKRDSSAAWRFLAASVVAGTFLVEPAAAAAQEKALVSLNEAGANTTLVEYRLGAGVGPTSFSKGVLAQDPQEQTLDERMTTSGFFLGIVGMLGGAAIGSGVGNAKCGDDCVTRYAAGGASTVGALMIPVGVRIANDDDNNPLLSYAASLGMGAVLWAGFNQVPGRPVAFAPFVAAPLQVWLVSKLERR